MTSSECLFKDKAMAITYKIYKYKLLNNIIGIIPFPPSHCCTVNPVGSRNSVCKNQLTRGNFYYYHYGCDGVRDSGWGCGYRTMQSMVSWILHKRHMEYKLNVPSIEEIQKILVHIGDKPACFVGSREWIGAMEIFYTIDELYDVSCKIIHITKGQDLKEHTETLMKYFEEVGGLVMMGGDIDAASKGIAGIHSNGKESFLLIVDPHYSGQLTSVDTLITQGYLRWQNIKDFCDSSFYNLCLPYI